VNTPQNVHFSVCSHAHTHSHTHTNTQTHRWHVAHRTHTKTALAEAHGRALNNAGTPRTVRHSFVRHTNARVEQSSARHLRVRVCEETDMCMDTRVRICCGLLQHTMVMHTVDAIAHAEEISISPVGQSNCTKSLILGGPHGSRDCSFEPQIEQSEFQKMMV